METDKKVLFVHTPCPELEDDRLEPPLGILYLAAVLRENDIPCQVCDLSGLPEEEWRNHLAVGDIYCFSTYSVNYHRTLRIRDLVRELNPQAFTISGGPHVSALPEKCSMDFDVVIIGEAETALLKAVTALREGAGVKGILQEDVIADLDRSPFPCYELVDMSSYSRIVANSPSMSLISSRGCPYNCEFCNSRVFARGSLRFRSPENIVREIQELMATYERAAFRFNDDLFTFSPERIGQMCAALKPLKIVYRIFARSSSMTERTAGQLYESGCRHVAIGIESMSEKMLGLLKKRTRVKDNMEALKTCREAGLRVRIYLLIGFPGETEETVKESLNVLRDCTFDEFVVYPFIPYPGTSIWASPERWGAEIDRDFGKYVQVGRDRRTCFAVRTKDFTPEDIMRWRQMMIDTLEKKSLWAGESAGESIINR